DHHVHAPHAITPHDERRAGGAWLAVVVEPDAGAQLGRCGRACADETSLLVLRHEFSAGTTEPSQVSCPPSSASCLLRASTTWWATAVACWTYSCGMSSPD